MLSSKHKKLESYINTASSIQRQNYRNSLFFNSKKILTESVKFIKWGLKIMVLRTHGYMSNNDKGLVPNAELSIIKQIAEVSMYFKSPHVLHTNTQN